MAHFKKKFQLATSADGGITDHRFFGFDPTESSIDKRKNLVKLDAFCLQFKQFLPA